MKKTRLLFTRRGKWDYCGDLWRVAAEKAASGYPLLLRALVASGLRGIRYYPSRKPFPHRTLSALALRSHFPYINESIKYLKYQKIMIQTPKHHRCPVTSNGTTNRTLHLPNYT